MEILADHCSFAILEKKERNIAMYKVIQCNAPNKNTFMKLTKQSSAFDRTTRSSKAGHPKKNLTGEVQSEWWFHQTTFLKSRTRMTFILCC